MVQNLTETISAAGQLDNTYILYTTDNGFHLGQHRMFAGKYSGLETDVHVPFYARGPGIKKGTNGRVTTHTDVAATVMLLADAGLRDEFDGTPMPLTPQLASYQKKNPIDHINIEFWGISNVEGKYGTYTGNPSMRNYPNNTYKSLHMLGSDYNMYYSVWCDGEHEFYDLKVANPSSNLQSQANYEFLG